VAENSVEIIRFSCVRQYFSSIDSKSTPNPWAEFRIFTFWRERPTTLMLNITSERMIREIERMEKLFQSIDLVKNELPAMKGRDYVDWTTNKEVTVIRAMEKKGEMRISIDGMEIEHLDEEEVLNFFKKFILRLKFGEFYRYVAFFGNDGRVKADYDEAQLRDLELTEHFRDMAEKDF
jgi:hypothetical protein